jgi:hypothetical protein
MQAEKWIELQVNFPLIFEVKTCKYLRIYQQTSVKYPKIKFHKSAKKFPCFMRADD